MLDQISVFVENKTGRLASVMEILHQNNVDIRALTVADTTDFGIIRIVVKNAEAVLKILRDNGCTAKITKVIGFTVPDYSGGLLEVINEFENAGINVEYCYSLMFRKDGKADIVVRVEDNDAAIKVLENKGISLVNSEDII